MLQPNTTPIGGYFELELNDGRHFHKDAIRLNSARSCLEYILTARQYKKVYLPAYTCEAVLQPIFKLQICHEFYSINSDFEPVSLPNLQDGEAFIYTNYFGLKQKVVESLAALYGSKLIIDNAQAFYATRIVGIDTFYSPRKFFGVADGGYLYTDCVLATEFPRDKSYQRMQHLLQRIDESAEKGYSSFRAADDSLDNQPILTMSRLTERILRSIDYETVRLRRQQNFKYLHQALSAGNLLSLQADNSCTPLVYPFMSKDSSLKRRLISEKVFVATYWPNVLSGCDKASLEYRMADTVSYLPIDQRYTDTDLSRIIKIIHE